MMEHAVSRLIPRALSTKDRPYEIVERLYLLADLMEAADKVLVGAYIAPNVEMIDEACGEVDLADVAKKLRARADAWVEAFEAVTEAAA